MILFKILMYQTTFWIFPLTLKYNIYYKHEALYSKTCSIISEIALNSNGFQGL